MAKYIIGMDLGGMSVKAGLFDLDGNFLCQDKEATLKENGFIKTTHNMANLCYRLAKGFGIDFEDVIGVGVGSPGVVESNEGKILRWTNFGWENVPLAKELSSRIKKPVFVINDANSAALGEARFGATKNYQSSIFLTIGTGIGGGIIFDGKLIEGYKSAGAELGHITIRKGGIPCACGRLGCYERYASASALILQTRHAMVENFNSKMWQIVDGKIENVDGKTAFIGAKMGDKTAIKVIDDYVNFLSEGIADLVNILRPEAIVLGGGIANEGEDLFVPLRKAVDARSYIAMDIVPLKIVGAMLGNKAGMYGAFVNTLDRLNLNK